MRNKILFLFVITMLTWLGFVIPMRSVSAAPMSSAMIEIKAQLAEFLNDLSVVKSRFSRPAEPGSVEALARIGLLRQFQAKMQTIRAKIADLRAQVTADQKFERLEKGMTNEAVRGLQKFLKQFPEIYPEGLETGFFGNSTENALKRFQQIARIDGSGNVDKKTNELINDLMQQGRRKSRPHIQDVSPDYGSSGITVTITGTGFTPVNNAIFVRGKTVVTGLPSDDAGTVIRFVLPAEIPCPVWSSEESESKKPQPKKACPIKVINTNGISNARPFKLVMDAPAEPPPEPSPVPTPPPPPPPPLPTVDIKANGSDGPVTIEYGTSATINWSSTDASSCSVAPNNWTETSNTGITTGNLTSSETYILTCTGSEGSATDSVIVNISGSSLTASCSASPTSALAGDAVTWTAYPEGGTGSYSYSWSGTDGLSGDTKFITPAYTSAGTKSASVTVTSGVQSVTALCTNSVVVSLPLPIIDTISPAEGPVGTQVTLIGKWFAATGNSINFAGTANAVMNLSSSDGKTLNFDVPFTNCQVAQLCSISVTNANGTSNTIAFLLTQKVTPVVVVAPNGGEIFLQGPANTIRWSGGTNQVELLLVASSTVNNSDPTDLIQGWISTAAAPDGSLTWDARTICDREKTVCSEVVPGKYKIMAVSEDEIKNLTIWNDAFEKPGNWDVSDQPFTIAPRATITITVPNFGGIFQTGTYMTICWITGDLTSKQVVIALVKDGAVVRILQTRTLYYATGGFEGGQLIPTDIPAGDGYTLKIYDPTDPTISDESDYPFTIVNSSSYLSLIDPNGGKSWALGFQGYINWKSMNIASQAVNINLFKGGVFYRTLASNVPQSYSWSTQLYSSGTFNKDILIPTDIPVGNDYTLEIVDSANPTLSDMSNSPFSIVRIPDTLTIDGRLIDYSTKQPIANFTYNTWDASGYRALKTDVNGYFSFTATTSAVISRGYQFDISPNCFETKWMGIYANKYGIYGWKWLFPLSGSSGREVQFLTGDAHFGDLPFWPMVDLKVIADTPVRAASYFINPLSGYAQLVDSNSYITAYNLWKGMPLNIPTLVKFEDPQGAQFYSPYVNNPSGSCSTKSISYLDGVMKWEPYAIPMGMSYSPYSPIVGQKISGLVSASGGVSPYNFNVVSGALPSGTSMTSSGTISGTTTTAGIFDSTLHVRDSNGVNDATIRSISVRTTSGTLPPSIRINYPSVRTEYSQGGTAYISWYSNAVASLSVNIDLLKGGAFYRSLRAYTQSTATGWFNTSAFIPKDVPGGSDYTLRISDASNTSIFAVSGPIWIVDQTTSAYWSAGLSWTGAMTYGQTLKFIYATSTIPNLQSFRLYQKKPGETSKSLVATFSDLARFATSPCSGSGLSSGAWYLYLNCYSATFALQRYANDSLSDFPAGTHEFELTSVDTSGVESLPVSTWKLVRLAITVNSPTSAKSPVASPPKLEWQIPSNWPPSTKRYFDLYVRLKSGAIVKQYYYAGPYSDVESTASKIYDGPSLDPTQTYTFMVQKVFNATDPLTGKQVSYLAASTPSSFWVK